MANSIRDVSAAVPLVEDSPAFRQAMERFSEAWASGDSLAAEEAWLDAKAAGQASQAVYGPMAGDVA
jgi:hypothetical protein